MTAHACIRPGCCTPLPRRTGPLGTFPGATVPAPESPTTRTVRALDALGESVTPELDRIAGALERIASALEAGR